MSQPSRSDPPRLVVCAIAGSLRRGSYNRALLRAAQEVAPDSLDIRIFDHLGAVPPYNTDVEAEGDPGAVRVLKDAIREADALLIATPEYNHSVPGVLKNAIDWASRPPGHSVLAGKPAAVLGASTGLGGTALAQNALRQVFVFTQNPAMLQPEFQLARAHEKFDEAGRLTDEGTRTFLRQFLLALEAWTLRLGVDGHGSTEQWPARRMTPAVR
ncbi:NADPH-dependent FMN reductase [Deinococcus apachensis]|uniref:NADPH-dependent FMN reductase n=1 Tax=Deinococcus apachensis TaxID=309886 RepID=UPI00037E0096|nr:NADPH-dependent FMN reductase [Deinococcus apachensis]